MAGLDTGAVPGAGPYPQAGPHTAAAPQASSSAFADDEALTAPSLLDTAKALSAELAQAVAGRLQLLTLELQRAGVALMQIIVMAVLSALLLWASWLALMFGVYQACLAMGLHWALGLFIVIGINVGIAAVLFWRAHQLAAYLTLPATTQALGMPLKRPAPEHGGAQTTPVNPQPLAGGTHA